MYFFFVVTIITLIDQIIKQIIFNNLYKTSVTVFEGVLSFTYVENTGGAYGVGKISTIVFICWILIEICIILCNNISILNGGVFDDEKTNDDICCNCYGFYGCKL